MKKGWLNERIWSDTRRRIPISCVDALLVKKSKKGDEIGLILRETPHQGNRWCLVGGRVLLDEPIREAILRHVRETLGPGVRCLLKARLKPLLVAEYFSQRRADCLFDPRQHAIAMTFSATISGRVDPRGEALDFCWFQLRELPSAALFGFDQHKVVSKCVRLLDLKSAEEARNVGASSLFVNST